MSAIISQNNGHKLRVYEWLAEKIGIFSFMFFLCKDLI